jgi:uncharacterized membrane protein SpoIIM required for sporulation/ribosomal protein L40E
VIASHREPITPKRVITSMLTGPWLKVVLIVFTTELAFLILGTIIPISQSTINQISAQNSSLANAVATLSFTGRTLFIFFNNFRLGALEIVPALGWFIFGYSMYNTALAVEVLGIVSHLPGPLLSFTLLLQPHSWLELPAYAIATTQSFYLVSTIARRRMLRFEAARTGIVFLVVATELIVAALFESLELSITTSLILEFVLPWALFAVLVGLLLAGRRRVLKSYSLEKHAQVPLVKVNFCVKCGARVQEGALYCDYCGQGIYQPGYSHL